jgi:tetratricopeptide (TPR) repeat protein
MYVNNTWVVKNNSPTVFIFVHGILSSSESCWFNKKARTYWPDLVAHDQMLCTPSVFVSGYTADLGSGIIDTYDAAEQVMLHLRDAGQPGAPLQKPKMVFVCHSQGGIVVRQMLLIYTEEFRDKKIGLILCGSPSWGSVWATLLTPMALLLRFRQASALKWGGSHLVHLDRDFGSLLGSKRIPGLDGMCLIETRGGLPLLPKFVSEASATRYFRGWHRIPKMTHGMIVKPDQLGHLSHKFLVDWVRQNGFIEASSVSNETAETFGEPPAPSRAANGNIQRNEFSSAINQYFVGRTRFRQEISSLIARLNVGSAGVYWVHGFGGMGKSFLLRRAFLDVPDHIGRCLIDWDDCTNRYRAPLRDRPRSIVNVFDALAHAFMSVLGAKSFEKYEEASAAVSRHETRRAVLEHHFDATVERLLTVLRSQPKDAFPELPASEPDQLETEEAERRHQESEVLLGLLNEEPVVKAVLNQLRSLQRRQEEFFDFAAWESTVGRWIRGVAAEESQAVSEPGAYLIAQLSAALMPYLRDREFVLFLDTHEVLSPRLDWYMLHLLDELARIDAHLLTVIAGRFEPDHKLPHPSFSGWHETLKEKLKTEHFAGNVRFTRTDVMDLLERQRRSPPPDRSLPDQILSTTLGVPMAVGMILAMHEEGDDILSVLSDLESADSLLDQRRFTQKIIGEVARRFLLHIEVRRRDEETLRDVIFLTLAQGRWAENLQELWWGGRQQRRDRLTQLSRKVDFIDGGSIHHEPARYFRESWAHQPHRLLLEVVDRSVALMEDHHDTASSSTAALYSWLTTYASLAIWQNPVAAYVARLQAVALRLADESAALWPGSFEDEGTAAPPGSRESAGRPEIDWLGLMELEKCSHVSWIASDARLLDLLRSAAIDNWPNVARACWHLAIGLAEAELANESKRDRKQVSKSAITHLDEAFLLFEGEIPNRDSVLPAYLEAAIWYSVNQDEVSMAQHAIDSLRRWRLLDAPKAGAAWLSYGKLLHNVRLYEESTAAFKRATELDPELWISGFFIAHNYEHQGKVEEELGLLEDLAEKHPNDSRSWDILVDWALKLPVDHVRILKYLRRSILQDRENAGRLAKCGQFFLIHQAGRDRSARTLLRRSYELKYQLSDDEARKAVFWLMAAEAKTGNLERASELSSELVEQDLTVEELNHFAWQAFLSGSVLQFGLECADRALSIQPTDHNVLNTKLAVLCRMGEWGAVPCALADWLRFVPAGDLRSAWSDHRKIFEFFQRSDVALACTELLNRATDPDFQIVAKCLGANSNCHLPLELGSLEPASHS